MKVKEKNKEEIFNEIYDNHKKEIYSYISHKIIDVISAEEILQETFTILYFKYKNFDKLSDEEISKILKAIAQYRIMSFNKTRKRRTQKFDENKEEFFNIKDLDPEEIAEFRNNSDLNKALEELTDLQREAITLVCLKGYSYKDAAKEMNKNVAEIKQLLHRGRQSMQRTLIRRSPEFAKRFKKSKLLSTIITVIVATTMITGIVYATYRVYKYIKHIPETYTLEERDKPIDENSVPISKDSAKEKIKSYLDILGVEEYDLDKVELIKDGIYDEIYWTLYEDNKHRIDINSFTGELISYNDFTEKKIDVVKNNNEIKGEIDDICNKLNINSSYKMIEQKETIRGSVKIIDFVYAESEESLNNSIIIEYVKDYGRIQNILNFSYFIDTDKNTKTITKNEAIKILKENYDVKSIESVELEIDTEIESRENPEEEVIKDYNLKTVEEKSFYLAYKIKYNNEKVVLIDLNNGELSFNNDINYEEKSD